MPLEGGLDESSSSPLRLRLLCPSIKISSVGKVRGALAAALSARPTIPSALTMDLGSGRGGRGGTWDLLLAGMSDEYEWAELGRGGSSGSGGRARGLPGMRKLCARSGIKMLAFGAEASDSLLLLPKLEIVALLELPRDVGRGGSKTRGGDAPLGGRLGGGAVKKEAVKAAGAFGMITALLEGASSLGSIDRDCVGKCANTSDSAVLMKEELLSR